MRGGAVILVALAAGHLVQTMNAEKVAAQESKPEAIEKVSAGPEATAAAPAAETAATVPTGASLLPSAAALTPAEPAATAPAEPVAAATVALPPPADESEAVATAPEAPALAVAEPETPAPTPELTPASLPDSTAAAAEPLSPVPAALDPVLAQPQSEPAPVAAEAAEMTAPAAACTPAMSLTAAPQAVITVSITAPCRTGERVVLRHAGLALAEKLSPEGKLVLDLPAMQSKGDISVLFPDAEMLRDTVSMPEVAGIHRFAVQWIADDAFQLHAFENGADYGQPGDVWAGSPVSPNGGFLISLGDPGLDLPMMAQVYTFPAAVEADIVIESAVTETTCGREMLGEVLESKAGTVTSTELTLAMPECDALGDILVLKNPGQDVTLAAVN